VIIEFLYVSEAFNSQTLVKFKKKSKSILRVYIKNHTLKLLLWVTGVYSHLRRSFIRP